MHLCIACACVSLPMHLCAFSLSCLGVSCGARECACSRIDVQRLHVTLVSASLSFTYTCLCLEVLSRHCSLQRVRPHTSVLPMKLFIACARPPKEPCLVVSLQRKIIRQVFIYFLLDSSLGRVYSLMRISVGEFLCLCVFLVAGYLDMLLLRRPCSVCCFVCVRERTSSFPLLPS